MSERGGVGRNCGPTPKVSGYWFIRKKRCSIKCTTHFSGDSPRHCYTKQWDWCTAGGGCMRWVVCCHTGNGEGEKERGKRSQTHLRHVIFNKSVSRCSAGSSDWCDRSSMSWCETRSCPCRTPHSHQACACDGSVHPHVGFQGSRFKVQGIFLETRTTRPTLCN